MTPAKTLAHIKSARLHLYDALRIIEGLPRGLEDTSSEARSLIEKAATLLVLREDAIKGQEAK